MPSIQRGRNRNSPGLFQRADISCVVLTSHVKLPYLNLISILYELCSRYMFGSSLIFSSKQQVLYSQAMAMCISRQRLALDNERGRVDTWT